MKLLSSVFILILGCVVDYVKTDADTENALKHFFSERCKAQSSDAISYDNFVNHLQDFSSYLQFASNDVVVDQRQFCGNHRPQLREAMRKLANDMYPCLPKQEKYLPKFLYESFSEFMDFLCRNDARNIKNFFSTHGKECRSSLNRGNATLEIEGCFAKIFGPFKNVVKKEELCEDIGVAKKCFSQTIQKHCDNFAAFQNLNNQFFDAISKPCGGCSLLTSSLFLVLASFIISKLFS